MMHWSRRVMIGWLTTAPFVTAKIRAKPGCQTSTWPIAESDFDALVATVEKIKGFDYRGYETSFRNLHFGPPMMDRARRLGIVGLKLLGVHIAGAEDPETGIAPVDLVDRVARGSAAYRAERIILSGSGGPGPREKAQALSDAARMARKHALDLAYHPHSAEFENKGDAIETILAQTDGKLVRLILDTGEAIQGEADVAEFFSRHHKRIEGIHLRDMRDDKQVALGQGQLDLAALARAIEAANWDRWLVNEESSGEEEISPDKLVTVAREQVQRIFGI